MTRRGATSTDGAQRTSRRRVLRGLCAGVVGGVAASGATAASAAGAQSTEADVTVVDLGAGEPADLPEAEELLVFVHGWLADDGVADQTADLAGVVADGGYEPDATVAIRWDASTLNYPAAESRTEDVGAALATAVEAHADATDGTVHLVGHSLGGRVVLETLRHLEAGYEVATVAPMGAAADGSTVTEGGRWYDGIETAAGDVRNYHSENDGTVGFAYGGWNDTALGTEGAPASGATPENYVDVDVTEHVPSHTGYTDDEAVGADLAAAILESDADDGSEGGSDDGGDSDGGDGSTGGDGGENGTDGSDGGDGSDGTDGSDGSDDGDGCGWCWW